MTDELFQIDETLSPRLKWIAKNGILTHHADHLDEDPWMAIQPFEGHKGNVGEIMAEWCGLYEECNAIGYGDTEDEAIVALAKKLNLKLWNE